MLSWLRKSSRARKLSPRAKQALFRNAFDYAPIGMALVRPDGAFVRVNPAFCHMLGYAEPELLGKNFQTLSYAPDFGEGFTDIKALLSGTNTHYSGEKRYVHKSGELIWVMLSVTLVRDYRGHPDYFIAHIVDMRQQKASEQGLKRVQRQLEYKVRERTHELASTNLALKATNHRLEQLAQYDALSGLSNRRELLKFMAYQLQEARRYHIDWCVIMMDIDYFKQINDQYGHIAGDNAVKAVGEILKSCVRETDMASRYGGDEFCLVFPHTTLPNARVIAEKIYKRIKTRAIAGDSGQSFHITCSIGLAEWRFEVASVEQMLSLADKALYLAKSKGRNAIAALLDT